MNIIEAAQAIAKLHTRDLEEAVDEEVAPLTQKVAQELVSQSVADFCAYCDYNQYPFCSKVGPLVQSFLAWSGECEKASVTNSPALMRREGVYFIKSLPVIQPVQSSPGGFCLKSF